jgi:hypothetical protein
MSVRQRMSRKAFFGTLGAAGLGLGLVVSSLGAAPIAFAQEGNDAEREAWENVDPQELRLRFYQEFTTALAGELNLGSADEVDPAIRAAWNTVIDGLQGDGLVTAGQATAVKSLLASAEVPVGPGPLFGPRPGMFMRGLPGGPGGPGLPATGEQVEGEEAGVADVVSDGPLANRLAIAERFYPDFTAALASELGAGSADEVDGAIRLAMIAVIDTLAGDDTIPAGPAEFMKSMVATAEAPLGPGLVLGPPPFAMMHGVHGEGHGPMFGGRGKDGHGPFGGRGDDDDASEAEEEGSPEAEDASS